MKRNRCVKTPSLNQAVTAEIIKKAYLSKTSEENAKSFSLNLLSESVRKSHSIIEGIRNGQSLGAILGYHFERFLHDNNDFPFDLFIYPLRRQFPLVNAVQISSNEEGQFVASETVEVQNVVDGFAFITFIKECLLDNDNPDYFEKLELKDLNDNDKRIIASAIDYIRNIFDSIGDLLLAESIYNASWISEKD